MSLEDETIELSLIYHASREYVEELERGMKDCNIKIKTLQQITDELFELAPAGPTKNALWRRYQALKQPTEPPAC
jgi:hypothetical protein